MPVTSTDFMAQNPHVGGQQIWMFAGNTRRLIPTQDEYAGWVYVGLPQYTISTATFDAYPVATG
jgi:hypothetical protein